MVVSHERHCNIAKSQEPAQEQKWKVLTMAKTPRCRAVQWWASHSRSVKRWAGAALYRSKPRPQIGLASLSRPTTAASRTATARTAASRTATARTAAEPTAAAARTAAVPTAAPTAVATDEIRGERRRWLPVGSQAVALDRARQSIAVARDSPVADIARPRVDDVGSGVHCLSVALPQGDLVAALEVHRERLLVPGQGGGACEATTD